MQGYKGGWQRGYRTLITSVVLFSLSACGSQSMTPLRVGISQWPGYEPLHLAESLHYIDRNEIELVDSASLHGTIQGLRNGDLDAGGITLDDLLLLVDQQLPLQVVLPLDFSNGGDAIIARKEIKSVAELQGRRIGLESTALGSYLLSRALEIHAMSLHDVQRRYMPVSGHQQAMAQGEVDAVVTFDPVRSRLLASGAHELFSSREIPYEIVDVLVVHQRVAQQQPQRLRHLIDAWYRSLDYLAAEPQAAAGLIAKRLKQTPAEVLENYQVIQLPGRETALRLMRRSATGRAPLAKTAARLGQIMLGQRMLQQLPDVDALISAEYMQ